MTADALAGLRADLDQLREDVAEAIRVVERDMLAERYDPATPRSKRSRFDTHKEQMRAAMADAAIARVLSFAAEQCEAYPGSVLHFWERPGSAPGNGLRDATPQDAAAHLRALATAARGAG